MVDVEVFGKKKPLFTLSVICYFFLAFLYLLSPSAYSPVGEIINLSQFQILKSLQNYELIKEFINCEKNAAAAAGDQFM